MKVSIKSILPMAVFIFLGISVSAQCASSSEVKNCDVKKCSEMVKEGLCSPADLAKCIKSGDWVKSSSCLKSDTKVASALLSKDLKGNVVSSKIDAPACKKTCVAPESIATLTSTLLKVTKMNSPKKCSTVTNTDDI